MSSNNYNQTLQFITTVKLQELEKQRLAHQKHAQVLDKVKSMDDTLAKIETLSKAILDWTGSGSVDKEDSVLDGKLNLHNLHYWLLHAKTDPNFNQDIAKSWLETLETHIRHTSMRFDCATLFGNLFNEWLASGDSSTNVRPKESRDDSPTPASEFIEIGRKEMHEQRDRLASIIFEEAKIDTDKLKAYLEDLFSDDLAKGMLQSMRKNIKYFAESLGRKKISQHDVRNAISGLLASGLMDEAKRATLAEFQGNSTVVDEVTSVLNMRMAALESWSWPEDGIVIEMRRHLNGKYRAFTDPEVIDALMLQYIGVEWQVKFKAEFERIFGSLAWKSGHPRLSAAQWERLQEQLKDSYSEGIRGRRRDARRSQFFLSQLSSAANKPSTYDDLLDAPDASKKPTSPAAIKQKLLHIMTTECLLNTTLHGSYAVIRSDFEWFGPSLPHSAILTVLEFFGVTKPWIQFFDKWLHTPLRFKQDPQGEVRVRQRGTPISYALSVVCGESVLFVMDFAVNQRADGLHLYRLHDDLWMWDADVEKCATGWREMTRYADLVGLTFNKTKTGFACVGSKPIPAVFPSGDIRWGFLKFDSQKARFVIDQAQVNEHITELGRQLNATKSVFGWVNAYNKYMAFFVRNFGGRPARCFGKDHLDDIINTLIRIQRALFPDGVITHLQRVIQERFGITDLPHGYFYLPILSGGLELQNPLIDMLSMEKGVEWGGDVFKTAMKEDKDTYKTLAQRWKDTPQKGNRTWQTEPFMSFEEFVTYRETVLTQWLACYDKLLKVPGYPPLYAPPLVETYLDSRVTEWEEHSNYDRWILALYGEEIIKKFGGLEVVDAALIPVGMVQLFRSSRMKLDE